VVFLRKLQPGGASRSFGIEVAKLAGLPSSVLGRAQGILASLEAGRSQRGDGPPRAALPAESEGPQMGLPFAAQAPPSRPEIDEVLARIRSAEPDDLTPRQAHELLAELKKKLT
jgi:DNA mismatch repair protein MutS